MKNFLSKIWEKAFCLKVIDQRNKEIIDLRAEVDRLTKREAVDRVWVYRMRELEFRIQSIKEREQRQ